MNTLIRLTLALAASGLAGAASAAGNVSIKQAPGATGEQRAQAVAASQVLRVQTKTAASKLKAEGSNVYPGTPMASDYRAYPPSCAADPLPDNAGQTGDILTVDLPLYTKDTNSGARVDPETVRLTLWRIACSSSATFQTPYNPTGEFFNSMTMLRIDRLGNNEGRTDRAPTMPSIRITQGNIGYDDDAALVRIATEPNTIISEAPFDSPIFYSTTYVLENWPYDTPYNHQYNDSFNLLVDPLDTAVQNYPYTEFEVSAYAPTEQTYPDAFAPLFLDGYAAAQWIKADTGDGLLLQVTEGSPSGARQLVYDLLIKDLDGNPFWLVGSAVFENFVTEVTVNANYLGAGSSTPAWGKLKFVVQHCNRLDVTFMPNAGLPAPVPGISETRSYSRLFNANGMMCE